MANPWMSRENIAGYPTLVLPTQFSLERGLYMRMTMHCAQTYVQKICQGRDPQRVTVTVTVLKVTGQQQEVKLKVKVIVTEQVL